jgi:hypothetical protein
MLVPITGVRDVGEVRAQPDAGDPAQLRELAERLLSSPFAGPGGDTRRARLLVGSLPELSFELPLPADARVIGSVVRPSSAQGPGVSPRGESIEIVLDVPASGSDVPASYEQTLVEHGWTAPALGRNRPPGGFVASSVAMGSTYCLSDAGPVLSVSSAGRSTTTLDLRLRIETGAPGPCGAAALAPPPLPVETELLPPLRAPDGVRLQSMGGSGGPSFRTSYALAETEMTLAELEARFAEQLATAGWTRRAGGADTLLAWSAWTVPGDGERTGLLTVQAGPGAAYRTLHIQATLDPTQAGAGPTFGWGTAVAPAAVAP